MRNTFCAYRNVPISHFSEIADKFCPFTKKHTVKLYNLSFFYHNFSSIYLLYAIQVHLSRHCAPYHAENRQFKTLEFLVQRYVCGRRYKSFEILPREMYATQLCMSITCFFNEGLFLRPSYKLFCLSGVNCLGIVLSPHYRVDVNTSDCYGLYTLLLYNLYII